MAKKKQKETKKNARISPFVWVAIGILIILVIFFIGRDNPPVKGQTGQTNTATIGSLSVSCLEYAQKSMRAEFCKYNLIGDELVNCRDSRVLEYLTENGIDTSIFSLNCRNIDNYSFRKTTCATMAGGMPGTKIAGGTCADYSS